MALTRLQLKNNILLMIEREGDTALDTFLNGRIDQMVFALYDLHDWTWKHKSSSFNTVATQEEYVLNTTQSIYHGAVAGGPFVVGEVIRNGAVTHTGVVTYVGAGYLTFTSVLGLFTSGEAINGATSGATTTTSSAPSGGLSTMPNLRSSEDIEVLWDSTNKKFMDKVDLHTIRKQYPQGSEAGKPIRYAPWGTYSVFLDNIPDAVYAMKLLYIAKPTIMTADANDIETITGIPDYCHYLLEKLVLAEAMIIHNDNRRDNLMLEIAKMWKPIAVNADMKHLESDARFKFWEEEIMPQGTSYDDFLRRTWWSED